MLSGHRLAETSKLLATLTGDRESIGSQLDSVGTALYREVVALDLRGHTSSAVREVLRVQLRARTLDALAELDISTRMKLQIAVIEQQKAGHDTVDQARASVGKRSTFLEHVRTVSAELRRDAITTGDVDGSPELRAMPRLTHKYPDDYDTYLELERSAPALSAEADGGGST